MAFEISRQLASVFRVARPFAVSLAGALLLALGPWAAADVPQELTATWNPCRFHFGAAKHTHSTVEEWDLLNIEFNVDEEFLGEEEYYFDVAGSLTNKMQDMTLHIVQGKDGAIPQPQIDPAKVCDSDMLPIKLTRGDFTYMVGVAELAGKPGERVTPHLVFFIPMRIGTDLSRYHFAFGVLHLSSYGSSATNSAGLLPSSIELPDDVLRALGVDGEGASDADAKDVDGKGDLTLFVSILLHIMSHNGIVHGSD
jgi:hypothetical protein